MKKLLIALLTMSLIFSTTGFSMKSAGTAPTKHKATKKVGFLVPTLQSEFFITLSNGVKASLEKKGYKVDTASFDMDSSKAISAIENFTVSNVDCIIAMVSDNSCDTVLKQAMDKGIKVEALGIETKYYDYLMKADNKDVGKKIGEMAADFVNKKLGGKADIAVMTSTQNTDMADRSNGILDALKKLLPKSRIVMKADASKTGDGTAFTENVLQKFPNTQVFVSYGDAMALEAVEALHAAGKSSDKVAAFGCDLTEQGLKKIAAGDIFRGTIDMGSLVTDVSRDTYRLLIGDKTLPKKYSGKNIKVTIANVNNYLKK